MLARWLPRNAYRRRQRDALALGRDADESAVERAKPVGGSTLAPRSANRIGEAPGGLLRRLLPSLTAQSRRIETDAAPIRYGAQRCGCRHPTPSSAVRWPTRYTRLAAAIALGVAVAGHGVLPHQGRDADVDRLPRAQLMRFGRAPSERRRLPKRIQRFNERASHSDCKALLRPYVSLC
jgi:hypothetical protein